MITKRLLLFVVAMVMMTGICHAQRGTVWKHFTRPDMGVGLLFHSLATHDSVADNNIDSRVNMLVFSVIGGLNFPAFDLAEDLTLGINPNLEIGYSLLSALEVTTVEAPSYITLKYGTDATWLGTRDVFGASIGIGYRPTLFVFPAQLVSFGMPTVMAEINAGKRRSAIGLVKLRYSLSLGSHDEAFAFSDGRPDEHIIFTQHAFHLVFTPGY